MEMKQFIDEMQRTTVQFKDMLEKQAAEVKTMGEASQETKDNISKIQDKLDEIETKMKRQSIQIAAENNEVEIKEKTDMLNYMRKGNITEEMQKKALSADSNQDGGYFVPDAMSNRVIALVKEFSPVRQLASIETISSGTALQIPKEGATDFAAGWVGERESRDDTTSGQVAMERIPVHEMYAKPKITQLLLDDPAFNFENFINQRIARRFAILEGTAFVSGDGNNKPSGILTHPDVSIIASGNATAITPDSLITLIYALLAEYSSNASFMMNRATIRTVRQFKDGDGQYLWQPSLQVGQPATLLGHPIYEATDMPTITANAFPIVFGDFRRAYQIVDKGGLRLLRDPYSSKPFVEFYTTRNTGGQVVLAEAIKKLKVSAS